MGAEVGSWAPPAGLGERHAQALDGAAGATTVADILDEVANAPPSDRVAFFASRESARLVGWLRALVLAEAAMPGGDSGARSPAIDVARLLRERGDYPADLTAWIRSVSSNRYLPYGSLLDRLR